MGVTYLGNVQSKGTGAQRGFAAGMKGVSELGSALAKTKTDLATLEQEKKEQASKYGQKLLDDMAFYKADKKPQEWEVFKQSDQYKQVYGVISETFPERVDKKTKDIFLPKVTDIYTRQLNKMKASVQKKIIDGSQLSAGEQKYWDATTKMDTRMMAVALDKASQDRRFKYAKTEEERSAVIQEYVRMLKSTRQGVSAPTGAGPVGANPNDPEGFFGKKGNPFTEGLGNGNRP